MRIILFISILLLSGCSILPKDQTQPNEVQLAQDLVKEGWHMEIKDHRVILRKGDLTKDIFNTTEDKLD